MLGLVAAACSYQVPTLSSGPVGQAHSSVILAADGQVIATVHGPVNRQPVPLSAIPSVLQQAVVATEDQRFWTEPAIDVRALIRAAAADLRAGAADQGASTIAEQYVKLALTGDVDDRHLSDKVKEAALAYELERHHGRAYILGQYLNSVYFGSGAYGVEAAAETYFGETVGQVDLAQAALLAGVIHAPNADDPLLEPTAATARRLQVLDHMAALRLVTAAEARAAAAAPLVSGGDGVSGVDSNQAPYFVEDVESFILNDPAFGATAADRSRKLFEGGLTIRTTLDLGQEADAESAVSHVLPSSDRGPAGALVTLDPDTGAVEALVGGEDFYSGRPGSQLDLATQAERQSGSTFKPFVLTTAVEHGFDLGQYYDAPSSIAIPVTGGTWEVRNYEGEPTGTMDLVEATIVSDNVVFAQLMMKVGPSRVVSTASAMGITTPLQANPAAVLGTNAVNPLEMADAYATLIDGGIHNSPYMISEVDGSAGQVLYRHRLQPHRVLPASVAYTVDGVLEQVVDQGTGVEARIGRPVAGKTGTTDNWADAWFVGGTPQLVSAVWVGYPSAEKPMVPPTLPYQITGGTWPAEIFQLSASAALAAEPVEDFPNPPSSATRSIDGPAGVAVDNVVGFPAAQATAELSRDGFVAQTVTVTSDEYPPGYVVSQSPAGGTTVPGGSEVALDVSGSPSASN